MSSTVWRTSASRSIQAEVVTSPATMTTPVLTSVSPAARIGAEDGVQHGVGNLVRDLVGVAFGHGLRGEQKAAGHDGGRAWKRGRQYSDRSRPTKAAPHGSGIDPCGASKRPEGRDVNAKR